MPDLQTPQSGFPYYGTYNPSTNYIKELFKPSVSVQTRELNDMQDQIQQQIEWFADNIFAPGTIVQGCNFVFYNPYPYVKIRDIAQDGTLANPSVYKNLNALNANNGLRAQVVNFLNGFEATDPNLNTLYIKYLNTGTFSNVSSFVAGDVLTIYDPVFNGVENILIANGGLKFSNTDTLVVLPQLQVSVLSGTFSNGDYINNGVANVQIIGITNVTSNGSLINLKVNPRTVDLANAQANSSFWTIANNQNISDSTSGATGTVTNLLGLNYFGAIITNTLGAIITVLTLDKGFGYTAIPTATVRSVNNNTGYATLNLVAQNYVANVIVAGTANSVGNGYAFGTTEGIIFQKGYFVKAFPQTVIVSPYNQLPDGISVAFQTNENIITSNIDTTLNDPAAGLNNQAPGADRMQLIANLVVMSTANAQANTQTFPIVSWTQGLPVKQQQQTVYSIIGDNMAQRSYETSGNYVINQFLTTTQSPINPLLEANNYGLVIDPGLAYIDGFRVQTFTNYFTNVPKSYTTLVQNNYNINMNYGSYAIVNNVSGSFRFNIGDTVYLYTTAKGYLSNTILIQTQNNTPQGNLVGNASIRSMLQFTGQPGSGQTQYKLYLFNIQLANGVNFSNVTSIYANTGGFIGICDVVQVLNPNSTLISTLYEPNTSQLLFPIKSNTVKNANNVNYNYRTVNTSLSTSNSGIITIDISASGNEFFPYGSGITLSSGQLLDLYIVPNAVDLVFTTNLTGTVTANTSTANLIGSGTSFLSQLAPQDYIYITSGANACLQQVNYIVNNTLLIMNSPPGANVANTSANYTRTFPRYVPIPAGFRSNISANTNNNGNILTINLGNGNTFTFSGSTAVTVGYNVQRQNITQSTKNANRNVFVTISLANNVAGTAGPWCLGVPDIFRLRGVWVGSNSSVSNTGSNYYNNFYIDHNQNTDFMDLGFLYIQQGASQQVGLTSSSWLLVEFDYFSPPGVGYCDTVSYIGSNATLIQNNDSQTLSIITSGGALNSFEIPELFSDMGQEMDLMKYIDFRPYNTNTAAPSSVIGSAPVNPVYTYNIGNAEKKFPQPGSNWSGTIEYYLCRTDSVVINQNANIAINMGIPAISSNVSFAPAIPAGAIELTQIYVPPYPSLEKIPSTIVQEILNTRVINQRFLTTRINNQTIQASANGNLLPIDQPMVYTMADIGNIDRRLQQVEYYVSLSLLEANISSLFIASSANSIINRYKFGYFTDDFTTPIFSDLNDPQYAATKELSDIVPMKLLWDVNLTSVIGTATYIETPIISQVYATLGTAMNPNSGPVCALSLANTVAYVTKFRQFTDNQLATPLANGSYQDVVTLTFADLAHIEQYFSGAIGTQFGSNVSTFSSLQDILNNPQQFLQEAHIPGTFSQVRTQFVANGGIVILASNGAVIPAPSPTGPQSLHLPTPAALLTSVTGVGDLWNFFPSAQAPPVSLYFYCYDTPTLIQVFQGNTFLIDSGSAQNLTTTEQNMLTGINSAYWFNDQTNLFMKNFVLGGSNTVQFAGKITWNYNFNASDIITIKTTTTGLKRWKWVISYPINGSSVGCIPPPAVWDELIATCINGMWVFGGYVPATNGQYAVTASTSQYDITQLWSGGANSVMAPGNQLTSGETSYVAGTEIVQGWYPGPI